MISCSNYDYIEIVCMHQYPVKITLKSGEVIDCKALDTQRNDSGEECIKVERTGSESKILLDTIAKLEVSIENPHFKEVCFT